MKSDRKIRIVFFADTHLGFDYPLRPKVKRRRRGKDFFDNYQKVLSYAIDTKADLLIHGGDLFFRSRVPQKIIDLVYQPLIEFADRGIPVFLVPGNHERSNLPTSLFLNHPNIHIFEKPRTFAVDVPGVRISLSGFPCERNGIRDSFQSLLEATGWNENCGDINLLCIHQAVEGAQVGPSNYTFRHGQDVIRHADVPAGFQAVLAGHIHRQQILWIHSDSSGGNVPVIYSGSTERTSFAEKGEKKGFFEISFARSNLRKLGIEGLHFIELATRPMEDLHITSKVHAPNVRSYIQREIERFDQNSIVRMKCDRDIGDEVRKMFTGHFLRNTFPETMNVQFSSDFFDRKSKTEKI